MLDERHVAIKQNILWYRCSILTAALIYFGLVAQIESHCCPALALI